MILNSRSVYSTGSSPPCPDCFMPVADCICEKTNRTVSGGGIAKIRREVRGRKGKTVTAISGLEMNGEALRRLASELKQSCGAGGSIKAGVILIQGDRISQVKSFLENKGFKVKQTGG
jgi:translation initiation factor 1